MQSNTILLRPITISAACGSLTSGQPGVEVCGRPVRACQSPPSPSVIARPQEQAPDPGREKTQALAQVLNLNRQQQSQLAPILEAEKAKVRAITEHKGQAAVQPSGCAHDKIDRQFWRAQWDETKAAISYVGCWVHGQKHADPRNEQDCARTTYGYNAVVPTLAATSTPRRTIVARRPGSKQLWWLSDCPLRPIAFFPWPDRS
jgi:hypothetical protein